MHVEGVLDNGTAEEQGSTEDSKEAGVAESRTRFKTQLVNKLEEPVCSRVEQVKPDTADMCGIRQAECGIVTDIPTERQLKLGYTKCQPTRKP